MSAPSYTSKWPVYAKQWDKMAVRSNKVDSFTSIAKKIIANKTRYQAVEAQTGVPWYMVGLIHLRESDMNFKTQLAQGDPLNRVSTHVPKGKGPYSGPDAWEHAAFDALIDQKRFDLIKDWRLEKILYYMELYNGWGYYNHGVPSAYIWAGSTVYNGGKYVADGVWSSTAVDVQPGVAPVLKIMMELDPSIKPAREGKVTTAAVAAGSVIAGGAAVAAQPHLVWPWVVFGVCTAMGLSILVYKMFIKKEPKNVISGDNVVPVPVAEEPVAKV